MTETPKDYRTGPPDPEERVELYRQEGETPRRIKVSVEPDGNVVLSSLDFPSERLRPFAAGGAREYEYFTTVHADAKDRYRGNPNAVEESRDWCEAQGIPCRFSTWGHDYC